MSYDYELSVAMEGKSVIEFIENAMINIKIKAEISENIKRDEGKTYAI